MTMRSRMRLTAMLAGLVFAAVGGFSTAGAATGPGGFTILHAATRDGAHHCEIIGGDQYGNQAIICADLLTEPTLPGFTGPSDSYYVFAQAEAMCENSSGQLVQCANIKVGAELANVPSGIISVSTAVCGHADGACPVGRFETYTGTEDYSNSNGCASNGNSAFDVWGIVAANATVIELPQSAKNVSLSSNFSTGHYYICM